MIRCTVMFNTLMNGEKAQRSALLANDKARPLISALIYHGCCSDTVICAQLTFKTKLRITGGS